MARSDEKLLLRYIVAEKYWEGEEESSYRALYFFRSFERRMVLLRMSVQVRHEALRADLGPENESENENEGAAVDSFC